MLVERRWTKWENRKSSQRSQRLRCDGGRESVQWTQHSIYKRWWWWWLKENTIYKWSDFHFLSTKLNPIWNLTSLVVKTNLSSLVYLRKFVNAGILLSFSYREITFAPAQSQWISESTRHSTNFLIEVRRLSDTENWRSGSWKWWKNSQFSIFCSNFCSHQIRHMWQPTMSVMRRRRMRGRALFEWSQWKWRGFSLFVHSLSKISPKTDENSGSYDVNVIIFDKSHE